MKLFTSFLVLLLGISIVETLAYRSKFRDERIERRRLERKVHDYEEVYVYESGEIQDEQPSTEDMTEEAEEPDPNPLCLPALPTGQPKPAWTDPQFYRVHGYLNAPLWDKTPTK